MGGSSLLPIKSFTLLSECIIIGLSTYILGSLFLRITKNPIIVLFGTGFVLHCLFELAGINKWYIHHWSNTRAGSSQTF